MSTSLQIAVLGCGYVGTAFAHQAKAAGHQVLGVVRSVASRDRLRAEGLAAEAFDLFAGDWSALPAAFDVVVYAASTGGGGPEAYALAYDVGVRRSLAWAQAVGADRFLFTSSTGVYRQDDGTTVDEESSVGGEPTAEAILAGSARSSPPGCRTLVCCASVDCMVPAGITCSINFAAANRSSAGAWIISSITSTAMTRRPRSCAPRRWGARARGFTMSAMAGR